MATSTAESAPEVTATGVRFEADVLYVSLDDGREIVVHLDRVPRLRWLKEASPEQRQRWTIEPRGFAVYWEELDDGIEVRHLLQMQPIS